MICPSGRRHKIRLQGRLNETFCLLGRRDFSRLVRCVDKTSSGAARVRNIEVKVEGGESWSRGARGREGDIGTIMWNLPDKSKYVFPRTAS